MDRDYITDHPLLLPPGKHIQCRRLFYQSLPNKTLHLKGEKCCGRKHSKFRLTGLAAGNAYGERLQMFVIRKSVKSRCFKGVKTLHCQYRTQHKSWMSGDLFEDWVHELDQNFALEQKEPIPKFYACNAISNQTFTNCLKKSEISEKNAWKAMNDEDDPFKGLEDDDVDDPDSGCWSFNSERKICWSNWWWHLTWRIHRFRHRS